MRLIALMQARNEDWVLGLSGRAALAWCDAIVLLNHASTDGTSDIIAEIAEENPGRVISLYDPDPVWREMSQRQKMLDAARQARATHLALVDSDEVLSGNLVPVIRKQIEQLPPGSYIQIPMRNLWRSLSHYRADDSPFGARAITSVAVAHHPSLAWQARNGYDHHHREPQGSRCAIRMYGLEGGVMHLQFASWRRLLAKHALYKMTERIRWPQKPLAEIERTYNLAPNEHGLKCAEVQASWWLPYQKLLPYLHVDREPWQERECHRLMSRHGTEAFAGLNLFGVVECQVPGNCVIA